MTRKVTRKTITYYDKLADKYNTKWQSANNWYNATKDPKDFEKYKYFREKFRQYMQKRNELKQQYHEQLSPQYKAQLARKEAKHHETLRKINDLETTFQYMNAVANRLWENDPETWEYIKSEKEEMNKREK